MAIWDNWFGRNRSKKQQLNEVNIKVSKDTLNNGEVNLKQPEPAVSTDFLLKKNSTVDPTDLIHAFSVKNPDIIDPETHEVKLDRPQGDVKTVKNVTPDLVKNYKNDSNRTSTTTDVTKDLVSAGIAKVDDEWGYHELEEVTRLADDRSKRYTIYDEMRTNDSLASSCIEIYADDITQPNQYGNAIWVESENDEIRKEGNRLLNILGIRKNLWDIAYSLVCYGDVYIELFRTHQKFGNQKLQETVNINKIPISFELEDYVERVLDPATVFDILYHGQTVGFARTYQYHPQGPNPFMQTQQSSTSSFRTSKQEIDLYDSHKFVHIIMPDSGARSNYKICIDDGKGNEDSLKEYQVATGKSIMQDAYKASQQLQLLENSILLARLTRASVYRLITVKTGNKSEADVISLLNRVRSLFDKKQTINTKTGTMGNYNNPSEVTTIVVPEGPDGTGSISVNEEKSDYDLKSIQDLEYAVNKELAAFKVPKQFLNFTDGGGFDGGKSLAKISAQYAHRLGRYKTAIIEGITTLINLFFENRNPDYVGRFTVKMEPANTLENAERIEATKSKLDLVSTIMSQLDAVEDTIGKFEILQDLMNDAYSNQTITKVLNEYIKKLKEERNNPKKEESEGDEGDSEFESIGQAPLTPDTHPINDISGLDSGGNGYKATEETAAEKAGDE